MKNRIDPQLITVNTKFVMISKLPLVELLNGIVEDRTS